jgi:hypothetical protein
MKSDRALQEVERQPDEEKPSKKNAKVDEEGKLKIMRRKKTWRDSRQDTAGREFELRTLTDFVMKNEEGRPWSKSPGWENVARTQGASGHKMRTADVDKKKGTESVGTY